MLSRLSVLLFVHCANGNPNIVFAERCGRRYSARVAIAALVLSYGGGGGGRDGGDRGGGSCGHGASLGCDGDRVLDGVDPDGESGDGGNEKGCWLCCLLVVLAVVRVQRYDGCGGCGGVACVLGCI